MRRSDTGCITSMGEGYARIASPLPAFLSGVNLLDIIEDGVIALDAQWRFTYLNRNAETLLRRTPGNLIGTCFWDEYPDLLGTAGEQACRRVMQERVADRAEEYYAPLSGWFEGRLFPSPDGGILIFFTNITERKRIEESLRASEERWRSLANAIPQFIWVAQSFGDTQFINDYWYEYTGLPKGDLSMARWPEVLHRDDIPKISAMWDEAVASGSERRFEYRARRASDGMWRWHVGFHRPERDRSGAIVRWIGTAFDIHDLKLAQEALLDAEERQRLAIEAGGIALWDWDVVADRVECSDRLYEFHGIPAGTPDSSFEAFVNLVHPDDLQLVKTGIRKALEGHEPYQLDFRVVRPDGTVRWLSSSARVMRDSLGRPVRMLGATLDITDRKNWEEALLQSEERFRSIVEASPECVKVVAADGTVLQMNPAGLAITGAESAEAVIGKSAYDLVAPEFREAFRNFNESVCGGQRGSLEFEITNLRGERRQLESHAVPLRNPDGTSVLLAMTRDVTGRKQRERAALLLSAIVDSTDDAIVSKDLNGVITSWNRSAERLFGYTAAEAVGRPVTILIPAERLDEETNILARLRRGERIEHFETIRRRKDGALLDVALTISPVKDGHGKIIGASKIARDISDRKRAEAALLASEGRFRQLADAMPQIVWTARPDGHIDYCNERWYQFSGFSREDLGDGSWEPILHPDDVQHCSETWYGSVRSEQPFRIECRFWDRKESRWRWFMGRALPVRDAGGQVVKWFGSWTDIDEQKRVEDELRRANLDLEQFAYSASHDLQEPLRSIKIFGELLSLRYARQLDGEARDWLNYLRTAATRMESLVRDLLAYTQLTRLEAPAEVTDAGEVLAATLTDLTVAIAENRAAITYDVLPAVRVHRAHLAQLFQNLVGNAIKYRHPDRPPAIHISANRQNDYCVFSVRDNGIGIAPEYRNLIFGLFKRLHAGDGYSGTGIGLAICQRLVERYHGRIWVESEPDQGSTFTFTLPG